jgi:hypothetical protein
MGSDEVPNKSNHAAMRAELASLLAQEQEISKERRDLHARLDHVSSPLVAAEERKLSQRRRDLHLRIDRLRIELNLLERTS